MPSRRHSAALVAALIASLLVQVAAPIAAAGEPRASQLSRAITLDTNLLSNSGLSAWAIDEYLSARTSLPRLGSAFLAAERRYGVNARFLLAAALHESGWGRSDIARYKHNLFGLNAYDRAPFRYASAFKTFAANIDATARFIKESYLTPGGRWWGGRPTLRSMQRYWSSSGRWGTSVSRVARSIRVATLSGRSIRFSRPAVAGNVHGGKRASVTLRWTGGAIPAGVTFAATWVPVALDVDDVTAAVASAPTTPPPTRVEARRTRSGAHAIVLKMEVPPQPGSYRLQLAMLDVGRRPLPRVDRIPIAPVEVRVWADRAADIALEAGADGAGVTLRITNTGSQAIPAARRVASATNGTDAEVLRSIVTVSATGDDPAAPAPVVLLAEPLPGDLAPGATATFELPGIDAATGRTTNWLAIDLHVLDDPAWLGAYAPVGAWRTGTRLGALTRPGAGGPAGAIGAGVPAPAATPLPSPAPSPTPAATPASTPAATPAAETPAATPSPSPRPTASPASTPAPKRVTKTRSEHSSSVTYRGPWGNAQSGSYLGGNVTFSTTAGATARLTFTGSAVSWIGPLGPTRGRAVVLVDGRAVRTVNLWRSSFVARAVLFKHTFRTTGRHTLTIKVLSSPDHPNVSIDGFTVRS